MYVCVCHRCYQGRREANKAFYVPPLSASPSPCTYMQQGSALTRPASVEPPADYRRVFKNFAVVRKAKQVKEEPAGGSGAAVGGTVHVSCVGR